MKKLRVVEFIESHKDWEDLLVAAPYHLNVSRDEVFGHQMLMLKYSQFDSDFNNEIVRECRGLILDAETLEPICVPFFKFGNYQEPYCPKINWKDCWVESKIDGSLIKVVKLDDDCVLVSTNGTIDAAKAPVAEQIGCKAKNFKELFEEGLKRCGIDSAASLASLLGKGKTYMFELTSPFTRVVVPWHETNVTFLGCRDNSTLQEECYVGHALSKVFDTPRVFPLRSLEECVAAAKELGKDEEGYVVCDKDFNRVKVKSPLYVSLHALAGNYILSYERALDIVRANEIEEVLTYFPEFKVELFEVKEKYNAYAQELESIIDEVKAWVQLNGYDWKPEMLKNGCAGRRLFAEFVKCRHFNAPGLAFAAVDGKVSSAREWLDRIASSRLVQTLGFKKST